MQLTIGDTVIPYALRASGRATRKRIVVTPRGVEVVVPLGTPVDGPEGVEAYVHSKRRWVFDSVRHVEERHERLLSQQYASGAKLQYRGRWLMLDVQTGGVDEVEITYRNKLQVVVPRELAPPDRPAAIQRAFDGWLKAHALDDAERLGRRHEAALEVTAAGYRLSETRGRWGSCGKDGLIRVHWQLIQAPAVAFDYVVAHEITHLLHRNHAPAFWKALGRAMPDWAERKGILERWEGERREV